MGWKIYAVISLLLFAGGAWDELRHPAAQTPVAWLNLVVGAIALVGLLAYAFRRRIGAAPLWLTVMAALIAANLLAIWEMVARFGAPRGGVETWGMTLAIVIALALTVPTAYALYAYARRLSAESGTPPDRDSTAPVRRRDAGPS